VSSIKEIRAALAAQVLPALTAAGVPRCEPRWPGQLNAPTGVVRRTSTSIATATMSGQSQSTFVVSVYIAFSDVSGQDLLDAAAEMSGPTSVVAAVRADPTLGGVVRSAIPAGTVEEESRIQYSRVEYIGLNIPVRIVH
jgi:hypothetical protein